MRDVGICCVDLGHVVLPTALYLQRYLVHLIRSRYVRAATPLGFHRRESGFRR